VEETDSTTLLSGTYRSCGTVWWQGECNRLSMWTYSGIFCLELLQLLKLKYMVWLISKCTVAVVGDVQSNYHYSKNCISIKDECLKLIHIFVFV
jgi:hypothetical protein